MPHATMRDGARLHYFRFGRGPDTCVLLHAFALPGAMWLPVAAPLAHRVRFIIPDLRGFGGSHRLPLIQRSIIHQNADDLHDLLQALELDDVYLGGLSMGACTAMQYHRQHGFDRIRAYLHMDQAPCIANREDWPYGVLGAAQEGQFAVWRGMLQVLQRHRHEPYRRLPRALRRRLWEALAEFSQVAFHHRGLGGLAALSRHERLMRKVAPTANWPVYLDGLRSFMEEDYDWRDSLRALRKPMTVLIGMQSRIYAAEGQYRIAEYVPHARLVPIDGCGHVVPWDAPLRFLRELDRFLAPAPSRRRQRLAGLSPHPPLRRSAMPDAPLAHRADRRAPFSQGERGSGHRRSAAQDR